MILKICSFNIFYLQVFFIMKKTHLLDKNSANVLINRRKFFI